jgi:hypothetical protein
MEEEQGEQRSLLRPSRRDVTAVVGDDFELAEDPKLQTTPIVAAAIEPAKAALARR